MATFVVNPYLMGRRIQHLTSGYMKRIFVTFSPHAIIMKPPNVLIFKSSLMSNFLDEKTIRAVENCLPMNKYVVYSLSHIEATKDPWMENCRLLLIPNFSVAQCKRESKAECKTIKSNIQTEICLFKKYLSTGGTILNFSHEFMKGFEFHPPKSGIDEKKVEEHATMLCSVDGGKILHSALPLTSNNIIDTDLLKSLLEQIKFAEGDKFNATLEVLQETPCYLLSPEVFLIKKFLLDLGLHESKPEKIIGTNKTLHFLKLSNFDPSSIKPVIDENLPSQVPVIYCSSENVSPQVRFDCKEFNHFLGSKSFGRVLIYADVVASTMDIVEPLLKKLKSDKITITCVAGQQTKGKGRGNNKWLSPVGTAMFSLVFSIPIKSRLGQHLPVIQHLTTVAVVHAVRSIPGLENLDLRVKWPNDIYIGKTTKIGGVLVKSTVLKGSFIVTVGCGVNVRNERPTQCINDLLKFTTHGLLSQEKFLALTFTCMENLINTYQEIGDEEFLFLYYKYWIHEKQEVKVKCMTEDSGVSTILDATVIGIDSTGFLRVKTKGNSEEISLQPDGNSFDITKNLIAMKTNYS